MIIKLNGSTNPNTTNLLTDNDNSSLINIYNKTFIELDILGSGSFASVYKSKHKIDSMCYAIKKIIISDDLIDLGYDVFDEVKMLSKLSHPHVIRYYSSWVDFDINYILENKFDSKYDSDRSYISNESNESYISNQSDQSNNFAILFIQTELCDYTLKEYIDDKMLSDSFEQRIGFWKQMVEGVKYIHSQGIIHRDIKPSNIFFLNGCVKIGDFGLSKNISSFALQISKSIEIGCGHYRAPEVDSGEYDQSIDIYSLGIILLEMLLGCSTICEKVMTIKKITSGSLLIDSLKLQTHQYDKLISDLINPNPKLRPKSEDII